MEDYSDRYGCHIVKLADTRASGKEFEFDRILLMPTAAGYRALVDQAKIEIKPRILAYLSKRWSQGAIENLSFFAMAVAVYARSIMDPPYAIDIGKVLLRTAAFCNLRCGHGSGMGKACLEAMDREGHHLPKCMKLPRDISITWSCLKRYIATGKATSIQDAMSLHKLMNVKVDPGIDFIPSASC